MDDLAAQAVLDPPARRGGIQGAEEDQGDGQSDNGGDDVLHELIGEQGVEPHGQLHERGDKSDRQAYMRPPHASSGADSLGERGFERPHRAVLTRPVPAGSLLVEEP